MNKCPYIVDNECDIDRCNNFFDRAKLLDKVAERIKEYSYEIDISVPPYQQTVIDIIDIHNVIEEMKAEVNNDTHNNS